MVPVRKLSLYVLAGVKAQKGAGLAGIKTYLHVRQPDFTLALAACRRPRGLLVRASCPITVDSYLGDTLNDGHPVVVLFVC